MTAIQLTIPFSSTLKLSEKHKCALITSQAKRLGINDWEINSLIQLCKSKGWISKGLALLYKYAGHIDELRESLSLFHHYLEQILNYSYLNLVETLGKISLIVIRIFYCISNWRKIQFAPRLLYITTENGDKYSLATFIANKIQIILSCLRKVSGVLLSELNHSLLNEVIVNIFGEQILRLHEETSLAQYDWLAPPSSSSASFSTPLTATQSKYFIKLAVLQIVQNEELLVHKWEESNHVWPVDAALFLPYPETKKLVSSMNWYMKLLELYQTGIENLGSILEEVLLMHSTMSQLESLFRVLNSLSEERFRSYWRNFSLSNEDGDNHIENNTAQNEVLLQAINPLIYNVPDNQQYRAASLIRQTNAQVPKKAEPLSPTHYSDESSLKSETNNVLKDNPTQEVKIEEENRSEVTENLIVSNKVPSKSSKSVGNIVTIDLNSIDSTVSNLLFTPKVQPSNPPTLTENFVDNFSVFTAKGVGSVGETAVPTAVVSKKGNTPSMQIVSPTSHSLEDGDSQNRSNLIGEVALNGRLNEATSIRPGYPKDEVKNVITESHILPSVLKRLPSVNFADQPIINSFSRNENQYDDIDYYDDRSSSPHLQRSRAHSAESFHADDVNFFNRERVISDPRGLSVDRYVRSYQVHKGRKTKRFDRNNQQLYHYGRLKRADFSFTSLAAALKNVDNEMGRLVRDQEGNTEHVIQRIAAKKISIWYRIMSPRKKLLTRLLHRNVALDIVYSIVDQSYNIAMIRHRRRNHLLRLGAAMRIQRLYRGWVKRIQEEEYRLEREDRKQTTDYYLSIWIRAVKSGIRIYRYIRYLIKRKIIRRYPTPIDTPIRKRAAAVPSVSLMKILDGYINLLVIHRRYDVKLQLQNNRLLKYDSKDPAQRRVKVFREYGAAVVLIQSAVRKYITRQRYVRMKQNNAMISRVILFLSRALRYRRRKKLLIINTAATKIQRFIRGLLMRRRLYYIVRAGLKLNFMWRKYVAYKALKSQLRRVDRPYTIILHGLRDLPKKYLTSDQIRFKLSVWWNPLLHIVSKKDFNVILQSKQPQYIYLSNSFKVMDVSPPTPTNNLEAENDPLDVNNPKKSKQRKDSQNGSHARSLFGNSKFNLFSSLARISRPLMLTPSPSNNEVRSSTVDRPPTGFFNPFRTKFAEISPAADGVASVQSENSASDSNLQNRPHQDTGVSSTSAQRKNSKKRSLRMSQNILPPSSLLQLAVTEEEEDEDEGDDGDSSELVENEPDKDSDRDCSKDDEEEFYEKEFKPIGDRLSPKPQTSRNRKSSTMVASKSPFLPDSFSGSDDAPVTPPRSNSSHFPKANSPEPPQPLKPATWLSPVKIVPSISSNSDSEVENQEHQIFGKAGSNKAKGSRSRVSSLVGTLQSAFIGRSDPSSSLNEDQGADKENQTSATRAERKRSSFLFSNVTSARSTRMSVFRTTINFAIRLRSMVKKAQTNAVQLDCMCNFDETEVKIPGCHGNSVFKFEILEGERKISHCFFYLGKEGEMMYWGGEYQLEMRTIAPQRRAAHANRMNSEEMAKVSRRSMTVDVSHDPKLDFRVIAGAPLRSRCQWARVIVRGKGPLKRAINNRDFMNSFNIFDNWSRFYLSLDEFGLHLFENKFCSSSFFTIPTTEFRSIRVELGFPIRDSVLGIDRGYEFLSRLGLGGNNTRDFNNSKVRRNGGASNDNDKAVLEDIHNVILSTTQGDEVYMRFPDSGSRNGWNEVLSNAILYNHADRASYNQNISTFSFFSGAFNSPKKMMQVPDEKREAMNRRVIFASRNKSRNKL